MKAGQGPTNSEKDCAFHSGQTIVGIDDESQSLAYVKTQLTGIPSSLAPSGRIAAPTPATPKVVGKAILPPSRGNRLPLSHALSCNMMICDAIDKITG
jgi:hypothetical protein